MPNDETPTESAETSPATEASEEALIASTEANLRSEQAEETAEAAAEAVITIGAITADEINELRARVSALEARIENDERNDLPESEPRDAGDDSGPGRSGDEFETETEAPHTSGDSSPIIRHWYYGKK